MIVFFLSFILILVFTFKIIKKSKKDKEDKYTLIVLLILLFMFVSPYMFNYIDNINRSKLLEKIEKITLIKKEWEKNGGLNGYYDNSLNLNNEKIFESIDLSSIDSISTLDIIDINKYFNEITNEKEYSVLKYDLKTKEKILYSNYNLIIHKFHSDQNEKFFDLENLRQRKKYSHKPKYKLNFVNSFVDINLINKLNEIKKIRFFLNKNKDIIKYVTNDMKKTKYKLVKKENKFKRYTIYYYTIIESETNKKVFEFQLFHSYLLNKQYTHSDFSKYKEKEKLEEIKNIILYDLENRNGLYLVD